ncbi:hypothetical protein HHE06_05650 [Helicobacter heilmannii]|nr:hypothetical protein HHE06_05650 [Helicobacter heilmannii]
MVCKSLCMVSSVVFGGLNNIFINQIPSPCLVGWQRFF